MLERANLPRKEGPRDQNMWQRRPHLESQKVFFEDSRVHTHTHTQTHMCTHAYMHSYPRTWNLSAELGKVGSIKYRLKTMWFGSCCCAFTVPLSKEGYWYTAGSETWLERWGIV